MLIRRATRRSFFIAATLGATGLGAACVSAACSSTAPRSSFDQPDSSADTGVDPVVDNDAFAPKGNCNGAPETSITGVVYDPAAVTPLYNVIVYIPTKAVDAFPPSGVTCDRCGTVTSGAPKVTALTNAKGEFKLENAPDGVDVPLVIQVGKWRRQVTIPKVERCKENNIADKNLTRLPKNKNEGDMPQIALSTGSLDALECLIRKFGIDDSEFTNETQDGKVHLYQGNTAGAPSPGGASYAPSGSTASRALWQNEANLLKYDILMLSCEGTEPFNDSGAGTGGDRISRDNLYAYANAGGRIFGTHYNYYWFKYGPQGPDGNFRGTADYVSTSSSGATYNVDTSFPKGKDFADWLVNVGASTSPGKIELKSVSSDVGGVKPGTERWIYQGNSTKYLSFNTPQGKPPAEQCGRAVFSDIHVAIDDKRGPVFPTECTTTTLSPQEQALEFLFFDLSSCVQDETKPPEPPK
jgi:hypothetical protein